MSQQIASDNLITGATTNSREEDPVRNVMKDLEDAAAMIRELREAQEKEVLEALNRLPPKEQMIWLRQISEFGSSPIRYLWEYHPSPVDSKCSMTATPIHETWRAKWFVEPSDQQTLMRFEM